MYIKNNVKDNSIGSLLIYTIEYIQNYFKFDPFTQGEDNREFYIKKNNSITTFKGINEAKCLELSVLFQNLFSFMGIDIELFKLYGIKDNGEKIGHVVNIINVSDMHIYFDLATKEISQNSDGSISYNPTIRELSLEDYTSIKNSEAFKMYIKKDLCGLTYEETSYVKSDFIVNPNQKKLSRNT